MKRVVVSDQERGDRRAVRCCRGVAFAGHILQGEIRVREHGMAALDAAVDHPNSCIARSDQNGCRAGRVRGRERIASRWIVDMVIVELSCRIGGAQSVERACQILIARRAQLHDGDSKTAERFAAQDLEVQRPGRPQILLRRRKGDDGSAQHACAVRIAIEQTRHDRPSGDVALERSDCRAKIVAKSAGRRTHAAEHLAR